MFMIEDCFYFKTWFCRRVTSILTSAFEPNQSAGFLSLKGPNPPTFLPANALSHQENPSTEATMHVPSYASWLERTDQSLAYAYLVKLMKLLQWQRPGKRWILKSPHHLEFMDLLDRHMGDVRFLWTHREVTECVPSFISMMSRSRVIFSEEVNGAGIARHWIRKTGYMLQKGVDYRLKHSKNERVTDIFYPRLRDQAPVVMEDIYRVNGGVTADKMRLFSKAEKENPMGKYGIHEYALSDFGAESGDILKETVHYREKIFEGLER